MATGEPRPAAATNLLSAEPEIALEIESDGGCGAPFLSLGKWSIWSSAMPYYGTRDGGDLRIGFLGRHSSGTSVVAGGDYWLRSHRIGYRVVVRTPLREQGGRTPAALARIESRHDVRRVSLMLRWSELKSRERGNSEISRIEVSCTHEVHRTPAGIDAWQWPRARILRVQLRGVGRLPLGPIVDGLRVAPTLSVGAGRADRSRLFGQVTMAMLGWRDAWTVWAKAALSVGRTTRNAHFDLATDGHALSLPVWSHRGSHFLAVGISGHQPLYNSLHGLAFATHARLPGRRFHVWEGGIGIGVSHDSRRPGRDWMLRIELPFWQSDPAGHDFFSLRRWSVRLWLWPRFMGSLASPDSDVRCLR